MEAEAAMKKIKMLVMIGAILWLIGFVMALSAVTIEFTTFKPALETIYELPKADWENAQISENPDLVQTRIIAFSYGPMIMTLKLVGLAFILSGVFFALLAILQALGMMPVNLGKVMKGAG